MPQININEIDQSMYRRTINDNKVKVLVPGIASFGPVCDGTEDSAVSFTDLPTFYKVFGYTAPEYNPLKNDVSRIYATQLINRGAEVTFIRLNKGETATLFDRADENKNKLEFNEYIQRVEAKYSGSFGNKLLVTFTPVTSVNVAYAHQYSLVSVYRTESITNVNTQSEYVKFMGFTFSNENDESSVRSATVVDIYDSSDNETKNLNLDENTIILVLDKQIILNGTDAVPEGDPSTSTRFRVTIHQYLGSTINTVNVDYTIDNTATGKERYVVRLYGSPLRKIAGQTTTTIKKVHKLESHTITTNPDNPDYIEDVEFNFIKFVVKDGAREQLALLWSNPTINRNFDGLSLSSISGFPNLPLKSNGVYNTSALLTGGYDFQYSTDTKSKLETIFAGINLDANDSPYTKADINMYIWNSFADIQYTYLPSGTSTAINVQLTAIPGVVKSITDNLVACFANYTDPYIYDFDFITAGGLFNDKWEIMRKSLTGDNAGTASTITAPTNTNISEDNYGLWYIVSKTNNATQFPEVLSVHSAMKALVETRKDCIALFDVMTEWNPDYLTMYVEKLNTSYGTVHAPWDWCRHPENNSLVLMPPSFVFLYTMLSNLINNVEAQKWFPPAGVTRATANIVVRPQYEIGSILLDKWQNNTLARVNPIMKLKNYGYVIYGQYTTYVAIDEFTHSALESLNVRLIANCVKKKIFTTCMKLTFEPNNSRLWLTFYDEMDKYLSMMKHNQGLYDYKIEMNESTVTTDDINELRCPGKVWINPTRTAEFFDIDFIITDAGVTFTE